MLLPAYASRFGRLIPLIVILSGAGIWSLTEAYFGEGYFERHMWTWALALFLAGAVCWFFGRALRRRQPVPQDDPKTGQPPTPGSAAYIRFAMREIEESSRLQPLDSLFFLHMSIWGLIFSASGLIVLLIGWLK